eukprot:1348406-Pyramimonas_sp.AAC.1
MLHMGHTVDWQVLDMSHTVGWQVLHMGHTVDSPVRFGHFGRSRRLFLPGCMLLGCACDVCDVCGVCDVCDVCGVCDVCDVCGACDVCDVCNVCDVCDAGKARGSLTSRDLTVF